MSRISLVRMLIISVRVSLQRTSLLKLSRAGFQIMETTGRSFWYYWWLLP